MKRTRNRIQSLSSRRAGARRKGAAIILAVCLLGVLVSMLAMAIDIGYIAASKAEARRTTDAAALAGCWPNVTIFSPVLTSGIARMLANLMTQKPTRGS
ncbi:MAG: pilus assembly protein TadG-related protein [bacterium]